MGLGHIHKLLLAITLTLSGFNIAEAQQSVSYSGTVRDADTGDRMAAVSVSTGPDGVGTVTNEDGVFIIKVPAGTNHLIFTHLGYRTFVVSLKDPSKSINVRMTSKAIPLSEIVVESPENIISAALELIPKNYPDHPEKAIGFYRETTKRRNRFIYVAEAVTSIYKTAYDEDVDKDYIEIIKGRRLISPKQSDTLGAKIQGGPMIPVYLDVAKNRYYILSETEIPNYSYSMEPPEEIDGRPQIVISFKPRVILDRALYIGKYYIDRETLAITRLDMQLDMSDAAKATEVMLVRKPIGVKFKPNSLTVEVDYQTVDNVTRISYQRTEMRFKCDWKRRHLFSSPYTVTGEMVVTARDTTASPARNPHTFSRFDSLYDQTEFFSDNAFWGDYNIIAPTERLNNAIDRLVRKSTK